MICQRISLPEGGYFDTYLQDVSPDLTYSACRPLVVVCPGGGYFFTSDREAEPVAMAFAARGYHTLVLRYPVDPARFPVALCCLGRTVAWAREHAEEYHIDPQQIAVCGFSAAGHLAACLGVFWNAPFLAEKTGLTPQQMQPDRLILSYPVITSGEFAHRGSFDHLLGPNPSQEDLALLSLEHQVTSQVPPCFIWQTYTDELVPVENSMLFAAALLKAGVPYELHIFSEGVHGVSLATAATDDPAGNKVCPAAQSWIDLACGWLSRAVAYREA